MANREIHKIGIIAVPHGNSGYIIVPKSRIKKRIVVMPKEQWDEFREVSFLRKRNEQLRGKREDNGD